MRSDGCLFGLLTCRQALSAHPHAENPEHGGEFDSSKFSFHLVDFAWVWGSPRLPRESCWRGLGSRKHNVSHTRGARGKPMADTRKRAAQSVNSIKCRVSSSMSLKIERIGSASFSSSQFGQNL